MKLTFFHLSLLSSNKFDHLILVLQYLHAEALLMCLQLVSRQVCRQFRVLNDREASWIALTLAN